VSSSPKSISLFAGLFRPKKKAEPETPKKLLEGNEVQFEIVLGHPDLRNLFHKFLESTFNAEPLMFMRAVSDFTRCQDPIEQVSLALYIVDHFVVNNSTYEINIDNKQRIPVLKSLEDTKQRESPDQLLIPINIFTALYAHVFSGLKEDGFPRYIKSELFYDFVTEKGTKFIYDIIMPSLNHKLPSFDITHLLGIPELHDALWEFAKTDFSDENIELWDLVQEYKNMRAGRVQKARDIFNKYIGTGAEREVSISSKIRDEIKKNVEIEEHVFPIDTIFAALEIALANDNITDIYIRWAGTSDFQPVIDHFIKDRFHIVNEKS
jgi:hypothetical protein